MGVATTVISVTAAFRRAANSTACSTARRASCESSTGTRIRGSMESPDTNGGSKSTTWPHSHRLRLGHRSQVAKAEGDALQWWALAGVLLDDVPAGAAGFGCGEDRGP